MRTATVPVGDFDVSVMSSTDLVSALVALAVEADGVKRAYALHVGGLAWSRDPQVQKAYQAADVVYADGVSVTLAARLITGSRIERSSTTDIGVSTLTAIADALGRPLRLALVGGPNGLAVEAARQLKRQVLVDDIHAEHGFHEDWTEPLNALQQFQPDVVLVGMGCPREMFWITENERRLPAALYLTVGGWFGFLAGCERRAPAVFRRVGLEWLFRLVQNPKDKFQRYALGVWHSVRAVSDGRRRHAGSVDR